MGWRPGLSPRPARDLGGSAEHELRTPPRGLGILLLVGPAFIWSAEYIGTGEVLLATRAGAVLGTAILWAVVLGILLKYWIGMAGARYTACTGEGMMDLFDRVPGPRHWAVWIVLVVQLFAGALSIGAVATAAGAFLNKLVPALPGSVAGWLVAGFAFLVAWTGAFDLLKGVMTFFVLLIVGGALYAAVHVFPGLGVSRRAWRSSCRRCRPGRSRRACEANPWREIMPLLGWGAGGFASQVWYTYWVLGAGYGSAAGRGYGEPADVQALGRMTRASAEKVKGWCHVVYTDATIALVIGVVVTGAFVLSGAGVLRPLAARAEGERVGDGRQHRVDLLDASGARSAGRSSSSPRSPPSWGRCSASSPAGPRLLADAFRLAIPARASAFRVADAVPLLPRPVLLHEHGRRLRDAEEPDRDRAHGGRARRDPAHRAAGDLGRVGLFVVLPRLLSKEAWEVLRPSPVFALGLAAGAIVFGWLTVTEAIPQVLAAFGGAQ